MVPPEGMGRRSCYQRNLVIGDKPVTEECQRTRKMLQSGRELTRIKVLLVSLVLPGTPTSALRLPSCTFQAMEINFCAMTI